MNKKSSKKKRNSSPKTRFDLRLKNTIMSNIMLVMLVIIGAVILIMFSYSVDIIKTTQNDLPAEFISSLKVFNEPSQTPQSFEAGLPRLRDYINSVISKNYTVKDVFIVNEKKQVVFTTLDKEKGDDYEYNPNTPKPFRQLSSPVYTVSNYRTIYINKSFYKPETKDIEKSYDIYLVVPQESKVYVDGIMEFSKWFSSIVLLFCLVIVYFFARSIAKPLSTMEQTVSKIAQGDLSGRLEYTKYYEINRLVQSYNMMANALQRLYSSLETQVQDRTKELKNAYAELQSTQAMMVHNEKMKSLGELVAGIMHEINNPINFIYGNMTHLSNYSNDLIQIIEEYTKCNDSLKPEEKDDIEKLKQEIDYDFLKSDLPDLIKSCKEGADRAKNIIQDLKSFSRMEEAAITDVDIPHEIDTTLNILHNKLKNKAEIHKEYMENVPKIEAFGGQLNQVFMNILDNAAGAIKEHGDIWIRLNTDSKNKNLVMEIEDNGLGMDSETARKIFDPFFTTKPVGQGTGLGLSITHKIIKNHQGSIRVESQPNLGTKFIITLPINIDRENLNAGMISGEADG